MKKKWKKRLCRGLIISLMLFFIPGIVWAAYPGESFINLLYVERTGVGDSQLTVEMSGVSSSYFYVQRVPGGRLWFQPNNIIIGTTVIDKSGSGNTGTIHWGTNPDGIEVTVLGMKPFEEPVAPGGEEGVPPDVLPVPTELELFEDTDAEVSHLPMYDSVARAAVSLGFSTPVMYSILVIIAAIGVGFGALVATGSVIGFMIGFSLVAITSVGTGLMPWWIIIICVLFSIFAAYVWRRT